MTETVMAESNNIAKEKEESPHVEDGNRNYGKDNLIYRVCGTWYLKFVEQ